MTKASLNSFSKQIFKINTTCKLYVSDIEMSEQWIRYRNKYANQKKNIFYQFDYVLYNYLKPIKNLEISKYKK